MSLLRDQLEIFRKAWLALNAQWMDHESQIAATMALDPCNYGRIEELKQHSERLKDQVFLAQQQFQQVLGLVTTESRKARS